MARPLVLLCLAALLCLGAQPTAAQTLATEADVTVGVSTQDVQATAIQARAFGELPRQWRFYGDLTWAARRGHESDAFGAAYPYEPDVRLMELYAERTVVQGSALWGTRIGRYRTPFGIYGRSDHGYTGFVRAPMIRYSDYWALSNNYLENGASVVAGATWLSAEASVGVAADQDEYPRPGGLNHVVRLQSSGSSWIVGASHIETRPSRTWFFATGDASFTGVDARWMHDGVQVRGEWLTGRPFNGAVTQGGYLDVLVHRPSMERVTAIARVEYLDYFAGRFSAFPRRYTAGTKVRASDRLIAQVNYVHQPRDRTGHEGHASLDVSLTFSARPGR
jgi:hypothetical protein